MNDKIEELLASITVMNTIEADLVKVRDDADGNYSLGKMTLEEWEEVYFPIGPTLVDVRVKRDDLQEELDELYVLEVVSNGGDWNLRQDF